MLTTYLCAQRRMLKSHCKRICWVIPLKKTQTQQKPNQTKKQPNPNQQKKKKGKKENEEGMIVRIQPGCGERHLIHCMNDSRCITCVTPLTEITTLQKCIHVKSTKTQSGPYSWYNAIVSPVWNEHKSPQLGREGILFFGILVMFSRDSSAVLSGPMPYACLAG